MFSSFSLFLHDIYLFIGYTVTRDVMTLKYHKVFIQEGKWSNGTCKNLRAWSKTGTGTTETANLENGTQTPRPKESETPPAEKYSEKDL